MFMQREEKKKKKIDQDSANVGVFSVT